MMRYIGLAFIGAAFWSGDKNVIIPLLIIAPTAIWLQFQVADLEEKIKKLESKVDNSDPDQVD